MLYQNWKSAQELRPEGGFESYRKRERRNTTTDLVTEQPDTAPPSYKRMDSILLEVDAWMTSQIFNVPYNEWALFELTILHTEETSGFVVLPIG